MPAQTPLTVNTAYYSQDDTAPAYVRQLQEADGSGIDLTAATSVTITLAHSRYDHYYSPYAPVVLRRACDITAPGTGWVSYSPTAGDLHIPGTFDVIFEINWNDGTRQTVPAHTYEKITVRTKPGGFEES